MDDKTFLPLDIFPAETEGEAWRHTLIRSGFVDTLMNAPEVRAAFNTWMTSAGLGVSGQRVCAGLTLLADMMGFASRAGLLESMPPWSSSFFIPADRPTDPDLIAEVWAHVVRCHRAWETALRQSTVPGGIVYAEAVEWSRGSAPDWPWVAVELVHGFVRLHTTVVLTGGDVVDERSLRHVKRQLHAATDIHISEEAGASADSVRDQLNAALQALPETKHGRIPKKTTGTLETYGRWACRHHVLGESIRSIARSDFDDEDRTNDVRYGLREARKSLGLTSFTYGGGDGGGERGEAQQH